jgi:hypothetical protein
MSYLKMALQALESMEASTTERGDRDRALPSKVVNLRPDDAPQTNPRERILTCYECGHFRPGVNSPNPTQAWGHCEKRGKGRYGVATACEAILTPPDAPPLGAHKDG